jgi:hypothetical protein
MRATDGAVRITLLSGGRQFLTVRVVNASVCGALAVAAFLLARRAVGAFSSSLPVPQLLVTVAAITVWALIVRELSRRTLLFLSLTMVVILLLALACSYPGNRIIDWLAWPTAMFVVVLCPPPVRPTHTQPQRVRISTAKLTECHAADAEHILQEFTRVRAADGHEAIHGTLIGEFGPGERHATLHIAFCPPFEHLPQVEVNVADDSDATVKLTQALCNGARLEVRLPEPASENTSVTIELFASEADSTLAV